MRVYAHAHAHFRSLSRAVACSRQVCDTHNSTWYSIYVDKWTHKQTQTHIIKFILMNLRNLYIYIFLFVCVFAFVNERFINQQFGGREKKILWKEKLNRKYRESFVRFRMEANNSKRRTKPARNNSKNEDRQTAKTERTKGKNERRNDTQIFKGKTIERQNSAVHFKWIF